MTDAPANTPPPRISRPRPRLCKAVKWGGLPVSVLLVLVWGVSYTVRPSWRNTREGGVSLHNGYLKVHHTVFPGPWTRYNDLPYEPRFPLWSWWPEWGEGPFGPYFVFPLGPFAFVTISCTAVAWRRDAAARRRLLVNHCPACDYDRAGLSTPDAFCPECGAAAPTAAPATERTTRPTR